MKGNFQLLPALSIVLGMDRDVRGDLLAAQVYDMSLVSKIHDQLVSLCLLFQRGGRASVPNRVFSAILYFTASRIFHPSGMTVGEEIGEIVTLNLDMRKRMRLFAGSIMSSLFTDCVLANLEESNPEIKKVCEIFLALNDAWFFLSRKPSSPFFPEGLVRPRPVPLLQDSRLDIPKYVRYMAGLSYLAKALNASKKLLYPVSAQKAFNSAYLEDPKMEKLPMRRLNWTSGTCAVCMGDMSEPTATVCGHVFCWSCIQEWTSEDGSPCPKCRTVSHPQELLSLVNYAPSHTPWEPFWNKPVILS